MAGTILLADMECLSDTGILRKYQRKSDGTMFSVQTIITEDDSQPQFHPNILSLENLSKFHHPNLAKYYGYALKSVEDKIHILVFLEDSKGALIDYIQNNELTTEEATDLTQELAEVLMFIDKATNTLPAYITPSSVLVSKDKDGNHHFKLFRALFIDSMGRIDEEDYKWMAPELYERAKYEKFTIVISTDKAVLYSVGLIVLYSVTKEVITQGRNEIASEQFSSVNPQQEKDLISKGLETMYTKHADGKLNEVVRHLLAYGDRKRADFETWQIKYRTVNTNLDISMQHTDQLNDSKYGWFNDGAITVRVSARASGKKSTAKGCVDRRAECMDCNMF